MVGVELWTGGGVIEHRNGILEEVNREGIMADNPQTRLTFRASPSHSPNLVEGKFSEGGMQDGA
jgi:hypothetical protein